MQPLMDRFGRPVEKLRISVTDRCNFRCTYCMPEEGMQWLDKQALLSFEEITRLAGLFVRLGVQQIRLTGGEPLLRKDLPLLVRQLRALPLQELAITTNGYALPEQAQALYDAGLHTFNVSLDSLDRERFTKLVRRDFLARVLQGLETLSQLGNCRIKLNAVVMRNLNEDEAVAFASLARAHNYAVRFIEFMPLGADDSWYRQVVVPGQELLARIQAVYPLVAVEAAGKNPAARWQFADGAPGEIGLINAVTEPFCHSCNRVRLTSDGQLRTCLFSVGELDLKTPLRAGASDHDLEALIREAVWAKEAGHLINQPTFEKPVRSMSRIGG